MIIEKRKLELIKVYWNNPRVNEQTVDHLVESIEKFGFNIPITIDKDDVIITGHTRYKAVMKMKGTLDKRIDELRKENKNELADNLQVINDGCIFAVVRNDLTPEQAKEFRIADNKIGELSRWDIDKLKIEMRELENVIGFTNEEVSTLLENKSFFDDYTPEDFVKTEEKILHHFDNVSEDEFVEVICPECRNTFSLRKADILREKPV